jgi:hypothetical protein
VLIAEFDTSFEPPVAINKAQEKKEKHASPRIAYLAKCGNGHVSSIALLHQRNMDTDGPCFAC